MNPLPQFNYRGVGLLGINRPVTGELLDDFHDVVWQIMQLSIRSRLELSTITKEPP